MSQIIINNGIILTSTYENIQPLIINKFKKKYITINDTEYLLDKGTLIILMPVMDNLKYFNIESEVDLITQNQFLIHNGDWWVNIRNDIETKKDIILQNKYTKLAIEIIPIEETILEEN